MKEKRFNSAPSHKFETNCTESECITPAISEWLPGLAICLLVLSTFSCHRLILPGQDVVAPFSFGVIADCQYCKVAGSGVRKYDKSDTKLRDCVTHFNQMPLRYVMHLGDFIDRDWESFDVVSPIYQQLRFPALHVLGNHDFSVADERKKQVPKKMGLPARYYAFKVHDWRFVVLDGNDISFHAHPPNSRNYRFAEAYYLNKKITTPKWNGAIGRRQLSWLKKTLARATRRNEKVILFSHFPIFPENVHNLWNAQELLGLIEEYPCVKACLNGHNHAGNYAEKNGKHFVTLKGMVDTDETAYAVVKVDEAVIQITGFGREESRVLVLPAAKNQ